MKGYSPDEIVDAESIMPQSPEAFFHSDSYLAINVARLEHLATITPIAVRPEASVLEVAAGIGDLTPFWLERGHAVSAVEARIENIEVFQRRRPQVTIAQHDLESAEPLPRADVVHAYGILYHLADPEHGLAKMAAACDDVLLLETCVSYGANEQINGVEEPASNPTQATSGRGCRPTRQWIFQTLKGLLPHVYVPVTQPNHPEFPLDWTDESTARHVLRRGVFIASRRPLMSETLSEFLPDRQTLTAG